MAHVWSATGLGQTQFGQRLAGLARVWPGNGSRLARERPGPIAFGPRLACVARGWPAVGPRVAHGWPCTFGPRLGSAVCDWAAVGPLRLACVWAHRVGLVRHWSAHGPCELVRAQIACIRLATIGLRVAHDWPAIARRGLCVCGRPIRIISILIHIRMLFIILTIIIILLSILILILILILF